MARHGVLVVRAGRDALTRAQPRQRAAATANKASAGNAPCNGHTTQRLIHCAAAAMFAWRGPTPVWVYSHSQLEKRPAHVPHGRARSTRQAARPPEFARRAPTGSQQGTGSYVRTYGITARIPSLEVDPPAIGSYGPQKHTFLNSTPFPKSTPFPISEKPLTIDYPLERDCVKVLTIQLRLSLWY